MLPSRPASQRRARRASWLALLTVLACSGGGDPAGPGGGGNPPPTASRIAPATGASAQSAVVGTAVPVAPAVRVTSNDGRPVASVAVTFAVTAGGGQIGTASAQTNADGVASAGSWTLGTTAGEQVVTATAGSLSTRLTATATPGPLAHVVVVSGGGQTGAPGSALAAPVVVRATDAHDNALPGVALGFAANAGGSAAPATATTNASGEAQTVWTLGGAAGAQTLTAASGAISVVVAATAEAAAPSFLSAARVEAGNLAQCAVSATGQLSCWGDNGSGLVGDGTASYRQFPVAINPSGVTFTQVSVGSTNACALTTAGAAYCWGRGGANGDGSFGTQRLAPVAVSGGHVFTKIVAGQFTVCALKADGSAWCWGTTPTPEASTARTVPTEVSPTLRFTDVATGATADGTLDYNCGISTTGATYCWGITGIGASPDPARAPATLGGGVTFTALTLGSNHACGLAADGRAYCWGLNDLGQVGDGSSNDTRATPVAVSSGSTRFAALTAGGKHTCGLTDAGVAYCWGISQFGQLGDGTTVNRPTPVAVDAPAGVHFSAITAGQWTTCGIATGAEVYCWGARGTQAIAIAELTPVRVPTR